MFLQYAIWGAWAPALAGYLESQLGFSGWGLGLIYAAFPLANLLAPFTGGQVADRWIPTQIALALFHLFGSGFLLWMAFSENLWPMLILMFLYCLVFAPTLALTNALAFEHLADSKMEFGSIRVWGTLGWIGANWALTLMRDFLNSESSGYIDTFILAAFFSITLSLFSLFLPHTPPSKEAQDPLAFRRSFQLLRNRNYLIFFIIAFVVATELQLYYILTFPYLQTIGPAVGITSKNLPAWMTIGQIAEILTMVLILPYALARWGVRMSMLVGILAWPIRYIIFAIAWPLHETVPEMVWLTVASLLLHGFCYVFFFVVAFIYTDMVAPPDIRASAQSLINVSVLGIGLLVGSLFSGWLKEIATVGDNTRYDLVFTVPAVITALCGIVFWRVFQEPEPIENSGRDKASDGSVC